MKVGDMVKLKSDGLKEGKFKSEIEQSLCGIVIGFKPRGWQPIEHRDPDCDVWNDAIVLWPDFGVGYNMRAMLEVIISV